jgi:hypothetical protein
MVQLTVSPLLFNDDSFSKFSLLAGGQFMCPAENLSIKGLEAVIRTNL